LSAACFRAISCPVAAPLRTGIEASFDQLVEGCGLPCGGLPGARWPEALMRPPPLAWRAAASRAGLHPRECMRHRSACSTPLRGRAAISASAGSGQPNAHPGGADTGVHAPDVLSACRACQMPVPGSPPACVHWRAPRSVRAQGARARGSINDLRKGKARVLVLRSRLLPVAAEQRTSGN
jgi:hypothetical protein